MKTRILYLFGAVLLTATPLMGAAPPPNISITILPTTITQDFNTLPSSGSVTWTNNSTLTGWYHARTGTGTTLVASDGSSNAGNLYSFGTGTNTDRALGSIGSGNVAVGNLFWGILLTNNTGSTITTVDVTYTGEQWRNSAAAAQTVSFSYLVGTGLTGSLAEFQSAGTNVASLDFTSPITGGTAGALDGNLAANRTLRTFTITGLSVANGDDILLRWSDPDHTGNDHGLAIDDFSVTVDGGTATPTPTATGTPSATPTATPTATPGALRIHDIQGAAHLSPLVGQTVTNIPGIVTAKASNGFYLQDPSPDSDDATSEGIFVFTSSAPTVNIADAVTVGGTVAEFRAGGSGSTSLTNTEISSPSIVVQSTSNPLPAPVVIGIGGRIPPMTVIEDDAAGSVETSGVFDPATDGIDFYESLEGMRVQINNPVAVGPTSGFGEIPVLSDDGANASIRTTRGGIVVRATDFNPERVFLDDVILATPVVNVGDHFSGPVIGVMDYSFGNFKLQITQSLTPVPGGLTKETTSVQAPNQIAVATFNVENLDPTDSPTKFAALASLIVNNLKSPDIITVEEIQDNNGATNDAVVDATTTYNTLISAIQAAGGPTYVFRQINPVDDQDGGEPGGNIRVGFVFRTDRDLAFIDRAGGCSTCATTVTTGGSGVQLSFSPGRIDPTNAAFNSSRKPLAGEFFFHGHKLFLIANHFNSKGGDEPLFGRFQPPTLSSETQRTQQAQIVNTFVDSILALDSSAKIVVLGDLNDFQFSNPLNTLKGGVLHALIETLPESERYTYVFEGNSQGLDHILLSDGLFLGFFDYAVVHVNSEFADQTSDHDPQVVRLTLNTSPTPTPTATATVTPTATATATATSTPTATTTATPTVTVTATPTATATATPTATATATPIITPSPTPTATATATPTATATATPTATPISTPSPTPTATATASATPTVTATATPTATATATPITTPSPTPTATATATPAVTATSTPTATATATPTTTPSPTPTATATPTATPASQPLNLSTRMRVLTGDNIGIGGFIITGSAPKHVLLRALGPSLTQFGVPDALADPVLDLHGPSGFTTITNDNWRDDPAQEALILASGIPPTNDFESAIDANLTPGAYTGLLSGKNNSSGAGLIELYDLDKAALSKLANISTRAFVSTGDDIVIAGFILGNNSGADRVVVRGLGPSLEAAGVPNPLANPTLELRDSNGALLMANNDWQDNPAQAAELIADGLAPTNNLESGIAATLPPGLYTALLQGLHNGTGVGLVEVYGLGP
jgi:predicted extracellular nuclease